MSSAKSESISRPLYFMGLCTGAYVLCPIRHNVRALKTWSMDLNIPIPNTELELTNSSHWIYSSPSSKLYKHTHIGVIPFNVWSSAAHTHSQRWSYNFALPSEARKANDRTRKWLSESERGGDGKKKRDLPSTLLAIAVASATSLMKANKRITAWPNTLQHRQLVKMRWIYTDRPTNTHTHTQTYEHVQRTAYVVKSQCVCVCASKWMDVEVAENDIHKWRGSRLYITDAEWITLA